MYKKMVNIVHKHFLTAKLKLRWFWLSGSVNNPVVTVTEVNYYFKVQCRRFLKIHD